MRRLTIPDDYVTYTFRDMMLMPLDARHVYLSRHAAMRLFLYTMSPPATSHSYAVEHTAHYATTPTCAVRSFVTPCSAPRMLPSATHTYFSRRLMLRRTPFHDAMPFAIFR